MKTFRIICLTACVLLLGYHLFNLNFRDLRFSVNRFHYMQIAVMLLVGANFLMQVIKDRKKQ